MGRNELSADAANRIADAVEEIETNTSRLREIQDISRSEYKAVGRQDLRDAVERKFVKLAEAVLDVTATILAQESSLVPDRRKAKLVALEEEGVLEAELTAKLLELVEFRDVLAHTYGPIVNDDIVYDSLQGDYERYLEFIEAINRYLSKKSPP